jgi:hypothetical protein
MSAPSPLHSNVSSPTHSDADEAGRGDRVDNLQRRLARIEEEFEVGCRNGSALSNRVREGRSQTMFSTIEWLLFVIQRLVTDGRAGFF